VAKNRTLGRTPVTGVARETEVSVYSRNWAFVALRGAAACAFALVAWAWSDASVIVTARAIGLLATVLGALTVVSSVGAHSRASQPWAPLLAGLVSVGFGIVALAASIEEITVLARATAAWLAIVGLLEGATATSLREHLVAPRLAFALAILTVGVAVAMLFVQTPIVAVWLLGAWSLVFGVANLREGWILQRDDARFAERGVRPSLL
jgi:uncharacterized membrane protein HdeD (DUF308 family)